MSFKARILAGGGSENGTKTSSDSWGGFGGGGPGRHSQPGFSSQASSQTETEDSSASMKGMKAGGNLLIAGGNFSINSADDAVHSNTSVTVSGGTFEIASGGDAFHADETLTVLSGEIHITESYEGLEGLYIDIQGDTATLDYDTSAVITGGTFIGTGASGMAQTFSDSEQGVISVSTGSQEAGTTVTITDSEGNEVLSYTPELAFQVIIFSSPDLRAGETYTVAAGTVSGEIEAD